MFLRQLTYVVLFFRELIGCVFCKARWVKYNCHAILMCKDLIVELGISLCTSMGLESIALHSFKLHSLEKFHWIGITCQLIVAFTAAGIVPTGIVSVGVIGRPRRRHRRVRRWSRQRRRRRRIQSHEALVHVLMPDGVEELRDDGDLRGKKGL